MALHLRKLCDAWNDWGHGDFRLHYVRDKEKREVDFLILSSGKPHALIETKLSEAEASPSLRYFHERLKPDHSLQVVRRLPSQGLIRSREGIRVVSAARLLACV